MQLLKLPYFSPSDYEFRQNLLDLYEIVLVPIYWVILTKISIRFLQKRNEQEIKLAKRALHLKFIGAIIATLLYNVYYVGGDTNAFFNDGRLLNSLFFKDPVTAVRMFWASGNADSWPDNLLPVIEDFRFAIPANTWLVCKFSAFIQFFTFRSMLITAMVFGNLSFFCLWIFYKRINEIFPDIKKYSPWAILYIPSMIVWGSGIFKDTICISALAALFVAIHQVWFRRKKIIKWSIIGIISAYLLGTIKSYILMSFGLSISIWLFFSLAEKFKNIALQFIAKLLITGVLAVLMLIVINKIGKDLIENEINSLLSSSALKGQYLKYVSDKNEGSGYDIGTLDPSISGFVKKIPAALNVTLFRPYLWESKKVISLFSAIESSAVLLLFLFVLWKTKVVRFVTAIVQDSFLAFCFVFVVIFGTFVGISSFNFGALVRYKIPAMPFFLLMLFIILQKQKAKKLPLSEPAQ